MRRVLLLLVIVAAGLGGYRLWATRAGDPAAAKPPAAPTPVLVAAAEQRDVPIYLDGLGTAQASATVTVRTQVDGTLTQVSFHEGQDVRAGDVLARIDPRTYQAALDLAVAKKAQDQASLANARLDAARYAKLVANSYTSAQQADTARAQVAQDEAQVAQDQAQIDTARAQLSYCTITSPIDGRTGIRQVDAGNLVHAVDTTGIVVITTLRPIAVVFTLPQQSLPAVSAAMQEGTAEVLALPQGQQTVLDHGTLAVLDNQVDPTTGTIKLKAMFPNDRLALWPGAFVTVRLRVETRHDATVVPPVAVQRGPAGPYVYVLNADGASVTRRPVQVAHEDLAAAVITDGVRPSDQVVVDGTARLTDGAKVTVAQPPTAPAPPPRTPETASRKVDRGAS